MKLRLLALLLLSATTVFSQGSRITMDPYASNRQGFPVAGATVAICQPATITSATVASNLATYTMATNPITAGFAMGMTVQVAGFTGGDTFFNSGTLSNGLLTGGLSIIAVSSTTVVVQFTHANATSSTTGTLLQIGNSLTSCAALSTIYTDASIATTKTNPFHTDGLGNYGVGVPTGIYYTQLYGSGIITTLRQTIAPAVSGGGGTPAAPNTSVQFNNGGAFGGTGNFTYTALSRTLTLAGPVQSTSDAQNTGTSMNQTACSDPTGAITGFTCQTTSVVNTVDVGNVIANFISAANFASPSGLIQALNISANNQNATGGSAEGIGLGVQSIGSAGVSYGIADSVTGNSSDPTVGIEVNVASTGAGAPMALWLQSGSLNLGGSVGNPASGSQGTLGQVLTSQGAGMTPQWGAPGAGCGTLVSGQILFGTGAATCTTNSQFLWNNTAKTLYAGTLQSSLSAPYQNYISSNWGTPTALFVLKGNNNLVTPVGVAGQTEVTSGASFGGYGVIGTSYVSGNASITDSGYGTYGLTILNNTSGTNHEVQVGMFGSVLKQGAGNKDNTNVGEFAGVSGVANNIGSGTVAYLKAFAAQKGTSSIGNGLVATSYGYWSDVQGGANITNSVAYYSSDQGSGANAYSFYSVGGKNFFGGAQGTTFGSSIALTEGVAASGVSSQDVFYGLTAIHWPAFIANAGSERRVCGSTGAFTSGHLVVSNVTGTICDLVDGGVGSGSGTVTNFSAANITTASQNFATQAVVSPGVTPALTFTIANSPAHKFFGNNTGGSAAPDYLVIGKADIPATVVHTDQTNVFGAFLQDLSASTLKLPQGAGLAATASSNIGLNTTSNNIQLWANGASKIGAAWNAAPTNGNCVKALVAATNVLLTDAVCSGAILQTNGVNNTTQTTLNFTNTAGASGINFTNPGTSVESAAIANTTGGGNAVLTATLTGFATGDYICGDGIPNAVNCKASITINAQTGTTYAILASDRGKFITASNVSSLAYTIAQAGTTGFEAGYFTAIRNLNVGTLTITPTTSTINGRTTFVLLQGMQANIISDGANYQATLSGNLFPVAFASLPACAAALEGYQASVNDSTTTTWGATITGGMSGHVGAYCDGTNWTVATK